MGYSLTVSHPPDVQTMQLRDLDNLSNDLEELRRKYDTFFLGMEKREPGVFRDRFERALLKSKLLRSPIMVVRYKYQQFMARVRTYQNYWDRVLREIEEGTYRRGATTQIERQATHLAESAVRRAQGVESGPELADDAPIESRRMHNTARSAEAYLAQMLGATLPETPAVPPAREPPAAGPPPREPAPASASSLFEQYLGAKKARGDDTSRLSLEAFEKSVEKQLAQARAQIGSDVELKVRVTAEKVTVVAVKKKV